MNLGARFCPGEVLARSSLFMYFATILQKFRSKFDLKSPVPTTGPMPVFTIGAYPFKVLLANRE